MRRTPLAHLAVTLCASLSLAGHEAAARDVTIRGKVLAHDGKRLPAAFVMGAERRLCPLPPDGSFSITVPGPGGYFVSFGGVHHRNLLVPLLVQDENGIELEVRLAAVALPERIDSLRVFGNFTDYAPEKAVPMQRQADGTFTATIETQRDTLLYKVLGTKPQDVPLSGTVADFYRVDARHQGHSNLESWCWSGRLVHDGKAVVGFDPRALPRSGPEPEIRFRRAGSSAERIVAIDTEFNHLRDKIGAAAEAFAASGGEPEKFAYDWSADRREISAQIAAEKDAAARGCLLLHYFEFAASDTDTTLARQALATVPPDSPLWSLLWGGQATAGSRITRIAGGGEPAERYIESVYRSHPDPAVRAAFVYLALINADGRGETARADSLYAELAQKYPDSQVARHAKTRFGPNRAIRKGNPVPDFRFVSLEDSAVAYTPADFRGKVVLLDFWAVWCGPCVAEMEHLHRAYESFHDRGFTILSLSADDKPETVQAFRKSKWPMPWNHVFLGRVWLGTEPARRFEVVGLPRPILVDREGHIAALEGELRGERLAHTLERIFGEQGAH